MRLSVCAVFCVVSNNTPRVGSIICLAEFSLKKQLSKNVTVISALVSKTATGRTC